MRLVVEVSVRTRRVQRWDKVRLMRGGERGFLTEFFGAAGLVGLIGTRKWPHLGAQSLPFSAAAAAVAAICTKHTKTHTQKIYYMNYDPCKSLAIISTALGRLKGSSKPERFMFLLSAVRQLHQGVCASERCMHSTFFWTFLTQCMLKTKPRCSSAPQSEITIHKLISDRRDSPYISMHFQSVCGFPSVFISLLYVRCGVRSFVTSEFRATVFSHSEKSTWWRCESFNSQRQ